MMYIARTVELAQQHCAQWAAAGQAKGEDFMKGFTFQVSCSLITLVQLHAGRSA